MLQDFLVIVIDWWSYFIWDSCFWKGCLELNPSRQYEVAAPEYKAPFNKEAENRLNWEENAHSKVSHEIWITSNQLQVFTFDWSERFEESESLEQFVVSREDARECKNCFLFDLLLYLL